MKLVLVLLLTCVAVAFGSEWVEKAPIADKNLAKQGFACQSKTKGLGPMKNGQVNNNYDPNTCASAQCNNGVIKFTSCGTVIPPADCKQVSDMSKPHPECCLRVDCLKVA